MKPQTNDVESNLKDGEAIDRAVVAAHRRVIERHQQLGIPLVVWQDGKVVEVVPDSVGGLQEDNLVETGKSA